MLRWRFWIVATEPAIYILEVGYIRPCILQCEFFFFQESQDPSQPSPDKKKGLSCSKFGKWSHSVKNISM